MGVVRFGHDPADDSGNLDVVEHPKAKGDRTTLAVMLGLQEAGYAVLTPFGENTRYDLETISDDAYAGRRNTS